MSDMLTEAITFAVKSHHGQKRKYTGDPYIVHSIAVMEMVGGVTMDHDALAAAVLHDVVEDCGVLIEEIEGRFGERAGCMVWYLTDVPDATLNRAARKRISISRLADAPPLVQTIKIADMLHNAASILKHDPGFAVTFMKEKEELVRVLTGGDYGLWCRAMDMIEEYKFGRSIYIGDTRLCDLSAVL